MFNVYYTPENYGLRLVFEEDNGGSWEFNMFVVWADSEGNLYYATDAGCSCPSPFEWATDIADLTFVRDRASLISAFQSWGSTAESTDRLHRVLEGM